MASIYMSPQQQNQYSQSQGGYDDQFPYEVRQCLSAWIQRQNWAAIDPENPFHEPPIRNLMMDLVREIDNTIKSLTDPNLMVTKLKFQKLAIEYRRQLSNNPVNLFRHIRGCLMNEMNRPVMSPNNSSVQSQIANTQLIEDVRSPYHCSAQYTSINNQLEQLSVKTNTIGEWVDKICNMSATFDSATQTYRNIKERGDSLQREMHSELHMQRMSSGELMNKKMLYDKLNTQKMQMESALTENIAEVTRMYCMVAESFENISGNIRPLQHVLDKELLKWKREQQLAGNGHDFDTSELDDLQIVCEGFAEIMAVILKKLKAALRSLSPYMKSGQDFTMLKENYEMLKRKFLDYTGTFVLSTFILEKQPPQVMKTNTRFAAKIRCLIGSKLNILVNLPQVKVSIISEVQANIILSDRNARVDVSGEILNNVGTMEYDSSTKQLSIQFRNMQLKKIKRAEKKGSESVVDEKFALFFTTKFLIDDEEEVGVWTMSLPVTVIVHGNQEPHAWATITWDNAFAGIGRRPFSVPDKVPWGKLATTLSLKFKSVTGKALSPENIQYLCEKLFRCQRANDDFDTQQVTWSMFCKESLPDRNFTFWDWFYAVMKLTKEHLKPLWTDGYIHGFVKKQEVENMLSSCRQGTFLLRFSDSEMGGITIAWLGESDLRTRQVTMLQPFTAKDFAIRSLADRVSDLQHLSYLYPGTPKDAAFQQHYTPVAEAQTASLNGYVKPLLITTVPGYLPKNKAGSPGRSTGCNSFPNTPQQPESPGVHSTISDHSASVAPCWPEMIPMDYDNLHPLPPLPDFGDFNMSDQSLVGRLSNGP